MNGKKWTVLLTAAVFMIGLTACGGGGGKYADLKPVIKKYNSQVEKFIGAMDKADSAEKVAAALTDFADVMKGLKDSMQKMEEKYPELKNMSDPPVELGEDAQKMQELAMKMGPAMMKAMKYADDPAVQKAQEALENIMK